MPTDDPGAPLTLDLVGGDVWNWTKTVTGRCRCQVAAPEVYVHAGGSGTRAEQKGGRFRAKIALAEGANEVVAECRACGRAGCRSAPLRLRRRLPGIPVEPAPQLEPGPPSPPAWMEDAVVYGVVPHNFGPDGLRSVADRLDDLQDLGITALWLAPCNATPWKGGHGYAVTDYFRIRRDYGTKQDLQFLVREAHARGMRVLMDFVPNHSSLQHRYLKHAERYGKASPYYDYYLRRRDGSYRHYFHWKHLPNLNYDHPEVRQWMVEAFSYWVRECDVDGFRIDAAWGIQQRRPDFWPACRRTLKRLKPDLLLLAEASVRDPYWPEHGFDAAYDWTEALGVWAWQQVFEDPDRIVTRLHAALTNEGHGFPPQAHAFRFINNNDTGQRFLTTYGLGMERVAAALLLTLPGLPCIYTGQEYGAEFEPYLTPGPIAWIDRHGLRDYYKRLIALRRTTPALHSRDWIAVRPKSSAQSYGYVRGRDTETPALVLLNFSAARTTAELAASPELRPFLGAAGLTDLMTGHRCRPRRRPDGGLEVSLDRYDARVLVPAST